MCIFFWFKFRLQFKSECWYRRQETLSGGFRRVVLAGCGGAGQRVVVLGRVFYVNNSLALCLPPPLASPLLLSSEPGVLCLPCSVSSSLFGGGCCISCLPSKRVMISFSLFTIYLSLYLPVNLCVCLCLSFFSFFFLFFSLSFRSLYINAHAHKRSHTHHTQPSHSLSSFADPKFRVVGRRLTFWPA